MVDKETALLEDGGINEDYASPPPYSPARSSTFHLDFPPEFSNGSRSLDEYSEDGKFLLNTSISSRTSAFIQAFMRPKVSPRLIDVRSDSFVGDGTKVAVPNPESLKPPPLDILVMVVDEDIEQFVYIAKHLLRDSHRVRIAASAKCEPFVRSQGLDFFRIEQRPFHQTNGVDDHGQVLSAAGDRVGDLRLQQDSMFETYSRCWRACIAPYYGDTWPFLSDVIIATPTAHAHFHCAKGLSIPLHIMSTMPQTPTEVFSHPRARFNSSSGLDQPTANMLSYGLTEEHTWYRSIEPINRFRQSVLGLAAIPSTTAAGLLTNNRVPHTYFCSKLFVTRSADWPKRHESGIWDSSLLATIIREAVLQRGFRAALPETWRHVSTKLDNPNIFVVDSEASEWLLPRVSLVVHNGDEESVKSALRHGKACVTIARTEDQQHLGLAVAKIGAGASPIGIQRLTAEGFMQAIEYCLRPDIQQATCAVQAQLLDEGGVEGAVQSFYRWLPLSLKQVCSITRGELAVFCIWNRPSLMISAEAAAVLLQERRIKFTDLVLVTRGYWNGFTNAARDIVNASDIVGKLPGCEASKPKSNPAKEVGVGTAKFFGNIPLLPFISTALVVNSAIYAVKSVQAHTSHESTKESVREATNEFNHSYPHSKPTDADQIQLRNDQHILAIFRRCLDRGTRSNKINDEKLRQEVLNIF
ncbi:hypothetical protein BDW72DRAFT_204868 [Aspergillus terricola var. indicus]